MKRLALAILLALARCAPVPAVAQPSCGAHGNVASMLAAVHGETLVAKATRGGLDLELYASPSGTWTLVRVDGPIACIVGAGEGYVSPPAEWGV